jgi:hypothetical protein
MVKMIPFMSFIVLISSVAVQGEYLQIVSASDHYILYSFKDGEVGSGEIELEFLGDGDGGVPEDEEGAKEGMQDFPPGGDYYIVDQYDDPGLDPSTDDGDCE